MSNQGSYCVAIVGAGPGNYAAQHLLGSEQPSVEVYVFDRLPTRWGLVRAGVALDHPRIKFGYRGKPLQGVPFNDRTGTILHQQGRVAGDERDFIAGWVQRGPSGVIGTHRGKAEETAEQILTEFAGPSVAAPAAAISEWLGRSRPDAVCHDEWLAIDRQETAAGAASGRPRVKLVNVNDLLAAARS